MLETCGPMYPPPEESNFEFVENPNFMFEDLLFNVWQAPYEQTPFEEELDPVKHQARWKGTIHDLYRMTDEWSKENEMSIRVGPHAYGQNLEQANNESKQILKSWIWIRLVQLF